MDTLLLQPHLINLYLRLVLVGQLNQSRIALLAVLRAAPTVIAARTAIAMRLADRCQVCRMYRVAPVQSWHPVRKR